MNYITMKTKEMATRAQAWGAAMLMTLILIVGQGMEARGQERVFDINALQAQAPAGMVGASGSATPMRTMSTDAAPMARTADTQTEPVLTPERIADFQNLYFNIQPAIYYNADGNVNDATKGAPPASVYVEPNQLGQLRAAATGANSQLATARLLVVQDTPDTPSSVLSALLADESVFPDLEFVVIKSDSGSGQLQPQAVNALLGADIFTKRPELIVVYNNLTTQN